MAILSLLCFIPSRTDEWLLIILFNSATSAVIIILASSAARNGGKLINAVHDWYPAISIFLLFKEVYLIIQSPGRSDWDNLLIVADRLMLGVDPTVWLGKFSSPVVTEVLQIAYASYYFIMITVGIELYLKMEKKNFSLVLFTILYGFFLSYLGYLAFPAVGPRFTLHSFEALNNELPGLFFTGPIRDLLNAGESIPKGVMDACAHAQRDAFPSGHTQMTLVSLYFAYHYKLKSRTILLILGTMLIISTVYLRYHYVVDLVGGGVFMIFTIWSSPKLFDCLEYKKNEMPKFDEK